MCVDQLQEVISRGETVEDEKGRKRGKKGMDNGYKRIPIEERRDDLYRDRSWVNGRNERRRDEG